ATPDCGRECYPELLRSTMYPPGPAFDRDQIGTSFAAPKVTHIAAHLQSLLPDEPSLLYRALIVQSARWPDWAMLLMRELQVVKQLQKKLKNRKKQDYVLTKKIADANNKRSELEEQLTKLLRMIGYGVPDRKRATVNTDYRTTFITSGESEIRSGEGHIYQVKIPDAMRRPADDYEILIEVTLSYVASPRRTRRNVRRYLSTWAEWKSNGLEESLEHFRSRALKGSDTEETGDSNFGWTLGSKSSDGVIKNAKRNSGTLQKDWAIKKSSSLPESFCVSVIGREGWSRDPDSTARYSLAVSFEILGQEIPIYDKLRVAEHELQMELQAEAEAEMQLDGEFEFEDSDR
ncbi:MAG: protease, partial [Planctomycetaceae bacterium]|nr:protease [Planctomycetaceae bacterium]